ncbi:hypothetical protein [Maribacter sp. MAR_2009_72]|uniref:hypothetical protein n=1 Tax=Maribacter sp. MAR_2009_72 TaxID=1250050 RepID=UPI00119B5647|nr:hypothetical protein [Maribacter sp. MAR_2009_72]TVZ15505.1 hypothetical protein JM81_1750 [Maribacter sp. MAR_2009_72]
MKNSINKILKALLVIFCVFSFISCNNKKGKNEKNENTLLIENDDRVTNTDNPTIYSLKEDCPETFKKINFSSLCFTDENTPVYKTGDMSFTKNRCQFTLADGQVELGIVFKDYSNTKPEETNDRLNSEKQAYIMTEKMMFKNNKIVEDFKYYAVISENNLSNPEVKKLTILFNNIAIYIETNKNYCVAKDNELLNMGQLVLESIIE